MDKVKITKSDGCYVSILVNLPDYCPHCNRTMSPRIISGHSTEENIHVKSHFCVTYRCPFSDCQKFFVNEYVYTPNQKGQIVPYTYLHKVKINLPKGVAKLSPNFEIIYQQAKTAEYYNLDQIAGIGYRKAVEFLIKDYANHQCPNDTDKIQRMNLSQAIQSYLKDVPKIQHLATASTWLGNDETHYIRKHTDKDIDDLKTFIEATIHFIAYDLEADEALSFISSK
nr:MAG TPA: protein of unknown function (DUF4145) [Caudoviricetes sp.]